MTTVRARDKTALVYRSILLPYSNTFVAEQVRAYQTWRGVLVGRRLLEELSLDGFQVRLLSQDDCGVLSRIKDRAQRKIGMIPGLGQLRSENPSLLHVHFATDALEAAPIARALDIPLVVTMHGYDINIHREWWESGNGGLRMRRYPLRLLRLSRQPLVHFIAVSEAIRRRAIEYGIPTEKITVCHIGIDTRKFSPGHGSITARAPRVLFVGRLVEKKGCDYLLEAMREVQKGVRDAQLIVLGDGPERQRLEQRADQMGLRATFAGVQSHNEVQRQFGLARLLCVPSITAQNGDAEGLPTVLLEALASGVPVVTSARGADEVVIDGATGFLTPECDVEALGSAISRLLIDDILARSMADVAPHRIRAAFDIAHCTIALERLYDHLTRLADRSYTA